MGDDFEGPDINPSTGDYVPFQTENTPASSFSLPSSTSVLNFLGGLLGRPSATVAKPTTSASTTGNALLWVAGLAAVGLGGYLVLRRRR